VAKDATQRLMVVGTYESLTGYCACCSDRQYRTTALVSVRLAPKLPPTWRTAYAWLVGVFGVFALAKQPVDLPVWISRGVHRLVPPIGPRYPSWRNTAVCA